MINIDNSNALLTEGTWTDYGDSSFLVAHMSNVAFQRAVMRRQAPYRSKIDKGTLDPQITRDLMSKAMADGLVLDWKKVVDGEGKDVPFSADACYKALKNNEDLRDYISTFAMDLDNFRQELQQEMGKN